MSKRQIVMLSLILILSITVVALGVELAKAKSNIKTTTPTSTTPGTNLNTTPVLNHYIPSGYKLLQSNMEATSYDIDNTALTNITLDEAVKTTNMPSTANGLVFFIEDTSSAITTSTIGKVVYKTDFKFPDPQDPKICLFRKTASDSTKYEYLAQTDCYQNDRGMQLELKLGDAMKVASQYPNIPGFVFVADTLPLTSTTTGKVFMKSFVDNFNHDMIRAFVIVPTSLVLSNPTWTSFSAT